MKENPWWNATKFFLKLLISAVALYFIFRKVDFRETFEKIKTLNIFFYVLAIAVFNISKIISTWKIKYFLQVLGTKISNKTNIRLYYIGSFYNLYLPGSIGGDGYKVWLLKKWYQLPARKLISVVFLDRLSGVVALICLTIIMLVLSSFTPPVTAWNWILLGLLLLAYPVYAVVFHRFFKTFKPAFHKSNYVAMVSQLLQVLCAWLILLALHAHGNQWDYLSLFMIAGVASIVPLTIGGLGMREAVLAFGADYLMIDKHTAVSFALLFFFVTAVSSLIGLVFAFSKNKISRRDAEGAERD